MPPRSDEELLEEAGRPATWLRNILLALLGLAILGWGGLSLYYGSPTPCGMLEQQMIRAVLVSEPELGSAGLSVERVVANHLVGKRPGECISEVVDGWGR